MARLRNACQAAVHLAAHRQLPPAARVRQAGRTEPGCARPGGASLDRVMSSPLAASTIGRVQSVAFAVPLLPGQAEANRVTLASCWAGRARRPTRKPGAVRTSSAKRSGSSPAPAGMWPWSTWRPTTSPSRSRSWGTSAQPFDRWFRGHARQVYGIAMDEVFTAPEPVPGYGTSRIWPAYSFDTKEYR